LDSQVEAVETDGKLNSRQLQAIPVHPNAFCIDTNSDETS
jgi:hypothetical protein